jgi:adenosylcobyric acid synthase
VINRFRGDIKLLESGLDWLEEKTGKPVLGVLPYLHDLALDAEDAITTANVMTNVKIKIAVLLLPHISNHTDFDTLRLHPEIDLCYVKVSQSIPAVDLIILPGSKNVISDLIFLKQQGWQQQINQHCRYGGKVLGICGGYQMLGKYIEDPQGIESNNTKVQGLRLLDITTTLTNKKRLTQVNGKLSINNKTCTVSGYEIHCGISTVIANDDEALNLMPSKPIIEFEQHPNGIQYDGLMSNDQQIIGTYLHGLFDNVDATKLIINWVNPDSHITKFIDLNDHREQQLTKLAEVCKTHLAIDKIQLILAQG